MYKREHEHLRFYRCQCMMSVYDVIVLPYPATKLPISTCSWLLTIEIYFPVCLCVCLHVCLSAYLYAYPSVYLYVCVSVCLYICTPARLSVYLYVCLCFLSGHVCFSISFRCSFFQKWRKCGRTQARCRCRHDSSLHKRTPVDGHKCQPGRSRAS